MYNVTYVAGPGHDPEQTVSVLDQILRKEASQHEKWAGCSKEQAVEFLKAKSSGEEGWLGDDMNYDGYRDQQRWGAAMIALFEATGHPVIVPVRHGAYAVTIDLS